jgi:NADPH2:quinone reductase
MKHILIEKTEGPEALTVKEAEPPALEDGQVLVKLHAIGVNFIDIYHRIGLYPKETPFVPGLEGAGEIMDPGNNPEFKKHDKVAFTAIPGAYAEYIACPWEKLVPLPDGIDYRQAAAAMLQGMTAEYLSSSTYAIGTGDRVLIHAAAGGVGLLLVQLAKMRGAVVIGTCGSQEKARTAADAGADHVVVYTKDDFVEAVRAHTGGDGVRVVYDSVGQATFMKSLECLSKRGYLVSFGQASGKIPPFDPGILSAKGSLYLTRPTLFDYVADRSSLLERASRVFQWISEGSLQLRIHDEYPLAEASLAHTDLENRKTIGKLLLIP